MAEPLQLPSYELLIKYDQPGPRYTSYPTVPDWAEQVFGLADYDAALTRASSTPNEPLSLYIHLPFCEHLCLYCGCNIIVTRDHSRTTAYLDLLTRELEMIAGKLGSRRTLTQLHWGGGTPTFLSSAELTRLMGAVRKNFTFAPGAELGIEVDPRVTSEDQISTLRGLGFNRLSVGVQDFRLEVQKAVNRVQSKEDTAKMLAFARKLGFVSTNVDLIYGLPGQTRESLIETTEAVCAMEAGRVALYGYAHVPWLHPQQLALEKIGLPSGEDRVRFFESSMLKFVENGYVPIGLDHFARKDDELARAADNGTLHRNFMGYTVARAGEMIGAGLTAIGDIGGSFTQNLKDYKDYEAAITRGELPILRGYRRTHDDNLRRQVILDLMCRMRLDVETLGKQFSVDPWGYLKEELAELDPFEKDGLIVLDRASDGKVLNIRITPAGRICIRNICMIFDAHLRARRSGGGTAKAPVFSRTL